MSLKPHALHHTRIITMFHAFRCVFTLLQCCVLAGLDWVEPMMHLNLHVICSCIRMHTYLQLYIFWYICCLVLFWLSHFLSFFLSLPLTLVASWHLSVSLLRPGTLFVLGHLLLLHHLTPLPLMSGSVMRRPNRTSLRTSHDAAFIRNAKSFCQTSLTLTCPLSSTIGVGSHYVAPRSCALPWLYSSSTPICMVLITLYPIFLLAFGVYAL